MGAGLPSREHPRAAECRRSGGFTDWHTTQGLFTPRWPSAAGTRTPVQSMIDYLEGGDSLDEFLAQFPAVSREHAIAVLEVAKHALDASASSAA